jgi:hypothetical protein
MDVIKASTSNYGETLDYLEKIERDELITREMSGTVETDVKKIENMSIFDLRKRHPGFTLPPVELPSVFSEASHPVYRCPYCGILLKNRGICLPAGIVPTGAGKNNPRFFPVT